jgi:hypothetical protein
MPFVKGHQINKGRKQSEETKQKRRNNNKGSLGKHWKLGPLSEEHRKKLSLIKLGKPGNRLGSHISEEHRKKLSDYWKGKKRQACSEETKIKIGDANRGKLLGTKHDKERIEKRKMLIGNKSPNWKGGISTINKCCRNIIEYKQWRSDVFTRDNWTCQTCGFRGNSGYINVHHIKGFGKILKENKIKNILEARDCVELWDIDNGITLCEECHCLTDNYKGKAKKYYKK